MKFRLLFLMLIAVLSVHAQDTLPIYHKL
ncbi:MAG: hypothetical protein RL152_1220, partial [Bacteroidota bacterium]